MIPISVTNIIIILLISIIMGLLGGYLLLKRKRKEEAGHARMPIYVEQKHQIIRVQDSQYTTKEMREYNAQAINRVLAYKLSEELLKQNLIRFDYVETGYGPTTEPPETVYATIYVLDANTFTP